MKNIQKITSSRLKGYSKLLIKKYRCEEKKFLVEGINLVRDALNSDWEIEAIVFCSDTNFDEQLLHKIENEKEIRKFETFTANAREFKKLSDTVSSQGIIAVVKMRDFSLDSIFQNLSNNLVVIALDNISDPGNLGTIIRTCDWFGVNGILLSDSTVELYNPKVVRSTMGGIFHLPIISDVNLKSVVQELRKMEFTVITTVLEGGKVLSKFSFPTRSLIIFGNEARGVSKEIENLSDEFLTIPKFGKAESLNVAIACGIVLNAVRIKQ